MTDAFGLARLRPSCTLNTDRTRDSAGRKVGLRTTTKGEQPHPAVTNPIPLLRASLSFLVKQPGGLGYKLHSKCSNPPSAPDHPWMAEEIMKPLLQFSSFRVGHSS